VPIYINDTPQTTGVYLGLSADGTCICATERKEAYVLRKLQRGLTATEKWFECCNIKNNVDTTQVIYVSHKFQALETHLTLNGRNISFVNPAKYIGVVFDKRITWRLHIEMTQAKAFRTFIRIQSLFQSERLIANTKINLHKTLIGLLTYACPAWELATDTYLLKLQHLRREVPSTTRYFQR
jgi:hypothetical protein